MKKPIALFVCLALACSLYACAESRQDETVPTEGLGATEKPADPTESQTLTPVSDGNLGVERGGQVSEDPWPVLTEEESAGGYVRLHNYVRIDYVDAYTQEPYDARYIVPEFTLDSEDALACNQEIWETCDPIVEQAIEHAKTSPYVDVEISYMAGYWNGAVSICVKITSTGDWYLVYTLDTQTGERLDDMEVALRAGVREEDYWQTLERTALLAHSGWIDEGAPMGSFIEMRDMSRSRENLEAMELFLGNGGTLMTRVTVYNDIGSGRHSIVVPVEVAPVDWSGVLLGLWEETLADKQNADQYVTLGYQEEKTYTTKDGKAIYCSYRLPKLLLRGTDAAAYTEELERCFTGNWLGGVYAARFYEGTCCSVKSADYRSWVWEDTLTVMVTMEVYDMPYVWCSVATFDLDSGKRLDNSAVYMRCTGQDTAASMEEIMAENLGRYFDQVHAQGEDAQTIARRRERTVTWDGMGMTEPVLYPDPDGALMALATIDSPMAHRSFLALVPMEEQSLLTISEPPGTDTPLEELVTVFDHKVATLSNSEGKLLYSATMTIPQVNINTPDGRACNWRLQSILVPSMEMRSEGFGEGIIERSGDISYDAWIWSGTLTLVVWDRASEEWCDYYIYVFDLETGELLDNTQVAALLGLTPEQASEKVQSSLEETFRQEYTGPQDGTYQSRLTATLEEGNLERVTLYPSATGELMALCRLLVRPAGEWHLIQAD